MVDIQFVYGTSLFSYSLSCLSSFHTLKSLASQTQRLVNKSLGTSREGEDGSGKIGTGE